MKLEVWDIDGTLVSPEENYRVPHVQGEILSFFRTHSLSTHYTKQDVRRICITGRDSSAVPAFIAEAGMEVVADLYKIGTLFARAFAAVGVDNPAVVAYRRLKLEAIVAAAIRVEREEMGLEELLVFEDDEVILNQLAPLLREFHQAQAPQTFKTRCRIYQVRWQNGDGRITLKWEQPASDYFSNGFATNRGLEI